MILFAAVFSVFVTGCSNETDKAIKMLGGDKKQQKEAMDIIAITASDPLPSLKKAIVNPKLSPVTRKNVAILLGRKGEEAGDETLVDTLDKAIAGTKEKEVKEEIIRAIDRIPGEKSLKSMQALMAGKDADAAATAEELLNVRANTLVVEANSLVGEAALPRQIKLLEEAVKINPANRELLEKLAGYYELNGQADKATALYNAGGAYVKAFKVFGPLAISTKLEPATPELPAFAPDGTELAWFDFREVGEGGAADFRKNQATKTSRSVYFASFKVNSKKAQDAVFKITTEDKVVVWVNGKQVFDTEGSAAEQKTGIKIKAGSNDILLGIMSKRYARFSVRLSDKQDQVLPGANYGI